MNCYVFRIIGIPAHLGHIGWGYELGGGRFRAGATEVANTAHVDAGKKNGFWAQEYASEHDMLKDLRDVTGRVPHWPYEDFKVVPVDNANPGAADAKLPEIEGHGYDLMGGNNCMDHTYAILSLYGAHTLPWPSTHWVPNVWFDAIASERQVLSALNL